LWNLISVGLEILLLSVCLEIVVILIKGRCMFCAECITGLEFIFDVAD
jgi:hypothetical protein